MTKKYELFRLKGLPRRESGENIAYFCKANNFDHTVSIPERATLYKGLNSASHGWHATQKDPFIKWKWIVESISQVPYKEDL